MYNNNPAAEGKGKGDYHVRERKLLTEWEQAAIIDATAHACALQALRTGRGPDWESVKKIVAAAKFGASAASSHCAYVNGRVQDAIDYDQKNQPARYRQGQPATSRIVGTQPAPQPAQDFDDPLNF